MALVDSVMTNNIITNIEARGFVASGEHSQIRVLVEEVTKEVVRAITTDAVVSVTTAAGSGSGEIS